MLIDIHFIKIFKYINKIILKYAYIKVEIELVLTLKIVSLFHKNVQNQYVKLNLNVFCCLIIL